MRALLSLLLLATASAGPSADPPRPLLVLRAACSAREPAAFTLPPALGRLMRVLDYDATCGAGWAAAVTRSALGALSGGGAVAVVGWPGAATCAALTAAARALAVRPPPVCALPSARAAAVLQLASRLGWRRVWLPRAPPLSECRAALREVARALAAAGLTVATERPHPHTVEIHCVSGQRVTIEDSESTKTDHPETVLLLYLDEPAEAALSPGFSQHDLENKQSAPGLRNDGGITDSETEIKSHRKILNNRRNTSSTFRKKSDPSKTALVDRLLALLDETRSRGELVLLTEDELGGDARGRGRVLEQVAAAARRAASAPAALSADFSFHVYRRAGAAPEHGWSYVGAFSTESTPSADDVHDWLTEVRVPNASDALGRRAESRPGGERGEGTGSAAAVLSACGGVALAAGVALAVRWAAARRRRRRRGGDAVLAPEDFTFPADERRCVGDGMETMLSCWLQQLHEFGGPELERPDLLKQPPAPRAPSAPSSTCSVNRLALDRRVRYKGDAVHVKSLAAAVEGAPDLDLKRKATDVLLLMQSLRHENLNPFIGCLCGARPGAGPALVWDHCGRGSLEDVLMADDIKLDWTFRLSLLTDLVKGMRYLHASPLRVHGRLSSRNCVVDSRWVLRVTDYGLGALSRAQQLAGAAPPAARELLWTAPELLRDPAARARGSQPGDVFSFAIIMQEVIVRGEPYCMLALSPEELVEKLRRPPPLIRPSVSMGAAPPEAVSVMRQCWSEAPDLRPDFSRLHDLFRHLHRGRKINIVDSMFEMLEKYSNNLEELIKDRTEQLDMEKKKTEQLLNRMLPRSVAERLLAGSRVEPEEFSDVSIYFSDIVGFTALAARCTPVQVVDLLNDLYTTFDAAIERYRVYKVETIGDAYMVVGGLPARAADHAASVATMALHLLHLAGRFRVRHLPDTPLHVRIGLHSGPCCAAVVGLTMPRYCLFGDTVNTASRMESTGAAWRIQVSAATAERLTAAGGYRLRSRGLVMIKGKGAMHTYWLLGKDGFDKPLPTPPPLPSEEVLFETDGENESDLSSGPPSATAPPLAVPASVECPAHEAAEEPTDPDAERLDRDIRRSGAVSADSSPPAGGARGATGAGPARVVSALSVDRGGYARYRRGAGLRRQWSLERGEALATAAAERAPSHAPHTAHAPLALLAGPPRAPPRATARAPNRPTHPHGSRPATRPRRPCHVSQPATRPRRHSHVSRLATRPSRPGHVNRSNDNNFSSRMSCSGGPALSPLERCPRRVEPSCL